MLISPAVAELVGGRQPKDITLRDLGSVRMCDLSSPEWVYQIVHAGLRQDFPALRWLETIPRNPPRQLTTFVGRERKQAEERAALNLTRMLTLCGTLALACRLEASHCWSVKVHACGHKSGGRLPRGWPSCNTRRMSKWQRIPPIGVVLFVMARIAEVTFEQISRAILPWLVPLLLVLAAITVWPRLTLWLPGLVMGGK